jgi:uncharacterized protein YqeY
LSLKDRIDQDMRVAQKSGDKNKLNVTRLLKSEIRYKEIDKQKELTDDEVVGILTSFVKRHGESIEEFKKGGREDLVLKEEEELKIIQTYLPTQLSLEELNQLITEAIIEAKAETPQDLGKVMKVLMPKVKGRADGKRVNALVVAKLQPN